MIRKGSVYTGYSNPDSWDEIHFSKPDRGEIIEAFRKIKSLACELGLTIVISMNMKEHSKTTLTCVYLEAE
jgi:hypothetical protein